MMKTSRTFLMACAVLTIGALTARADSPAEATYQSALAHYNAADYDAVLRECAEAVRTDPNHWQAWSLLGNARYARGDKKGALEAYDRSLAINPDNPQLKTFADQLRPQVAAESPASTGVMTLPRSARPTEMPKDDQATGHHGMSVGVGYISVPVTYDYVQVNLTTGAETQKSAPLAMSSFLVMHSVEYAVTDQIGITFAVGAGKSLSAGVFDQTQKATGGTAFTSKNSTNEGDSFQYEAAVFPVLAGAVYHLPIGNNEAQLGVGLGALFVNITETLIDVNWAGTPPSETNSYTDTFTDNFSATPFVIMVRPGFRFNLGSGRGIDLGLNLGYMLSDKFSYLSTENQFSPLPPGLLGTENTGATLGGLTYGLQAAFTTTL